ncbi:MAG: hypothetical protein LBI92_02590 [Azoarcus sp.]|jgi:hypothetical protein|nr:hypothetical protein [Azoarcus sp.]
MTTQARIIAAALALLLFGAGLWFGMVLERPKTARAELALANEQARYARAEADARRRTLAAEREGARLAVQLQIIEAARARRGEERDREIAKLAVGRPCLSADLTRLLNESAAAGARVSANTGGANRTDGRFATDTDVGQWIDGARRQYDLCRGRLDAVRQWQTTQLNTGE